MLNQRKIFRRRRLTRDNASEGAKQRFPQHQRFAQYLGRASLLRVGFALQSRSFLRADILGLCGEADQVVVGL